jgi:hypothetical protein
MKPATNGRGRPPKGTQAEDVAILQAWRMAQSSGVSRKQFAVEQSLSPDELERAIQRASKREKQNRVSGFSQVPRPHTRSGPSSRRAER